MLALLFFFFAYVVDSDANVNFLIVTFTLLQLQDEYRKVSEECSQYKQISQATKQKETKATSMVSELTSVRCPTSFLLITYYHDTPLSSQLKLFLEILHELIGKLFGQMPPYR